MSARNPATSRPASLLPREHGATMELLFPLLSAWLLGRPGFASLLLGVAAMLAFACHEPLFVLLGKRGARRAREESGRARLRLAWLAGLAAVLGGAGLWAATPLVRGLSLLPAGIGASALLLSARGRGKGLATELHVALALSTLALPVAVAAGIPLASAVMLASVWMVGFAVGTTAARAVLLQKKDRGRGRRLSLVVSVLVAATALPLGLSGLVPAWVPLSPLPFVLVALLLSWRPPPPRHMTPIGLGLLGASTVTLALLLAVAGG